MLRDFGGSLCGVAAFVVVLVFPGYIAARWLLPTFRTSGLREQAAWSIALSFGVGTIAIVALVWLAGVDATGWLLTASAALVCWFVRNGPPRPDLTRRQVRWWTAIGVAWTGFVLLSLVDLGVTNRLWMSVVSYDHSVRTAFAGAVMRTGVPPANPLYWPGHASPMRYYYFWYVLCGVVGRLAHISARQAFIASCVWPIAGVAAMLGLFARYVLKRRGQQLQQSWTLAMVLLSVTGLDLLANIGAHLAGDRLYGDMEWWSVDQVSSWTDTFLWVPHHAAALVCCLLGMLLLYLLAEQTNGTSQAKVIVAAGLCFASAFGLSSYLAIGAAIIVFAWAVWRALQGRPRLIGAGLLAGATAFLALLPYFHQLLQPGTGGTAPAHVLGFGVRKMLDPTMLANAPGFRMLAIHHPVLETNVAAFVLLLPGYLAELGFYGFVLVLASAYKGKRREGERMLLVLTWAGLAAVTFIRSQVLVTNDYGYRASLLPQFFLLLLAVLIWNRGSRWQKRILLILALIGGLGTLYQVVVLRIFFPVHQLRGDPAMTDLAEQNYALRDVFHAVDASLPHNARLQYNTSVTNLVMFAQMLQANRQIVNADAGCSTNFGGERSACAPIQSAVATIYQAPFASADEAALQCKRMDADYLLVTRWDGAWNDHSSFAWTLPAVVQTPDARVLACRFPR